MEPPLRELEAPGGIRIPTDRRYSRDHLWVRQEPASSGRFRIGLSAYACRWGIEVYFIEQLPPPGATVEAHQEFGVVETEKRAVSLSVPFAFEVGEINERVLKDPSIITFDGHGAGWIIGGEGEPTNLISAEEYVKFLETLPPPQCFIKEPNAS